MMIEAETAPAVQYGACPARAAREAWLSPRHALREDEWYALMFEQYVRPVPRARSPHRHALRLYRAGRHLQQTARFCCFKQKYYRPVKLPGCAVGLSCPPWFQCDWCNCTLWPCRCVQQSSDVTNPQPIPRGPTRMQAKGGISFFAKLFRAAADGCLCEMKAPGPNFCPADRLDFMCGRGRGLHFETRRRIRMLAEAEQRQDGVFQEEIDVHKISPRGSYMAEEKKKFRSIGVQTYTELDDVTLYVGKRDKELAPRVSPLRTGARPRRDARRRDAAARQRGSGDAHARAPPLPPVNTTPPPTAENSASKSPEIVPTSTSTGPTKDDHALKGQTEAVEGPVELAGPTSPQSTPEVAVGPTSPRFTPEGGPVGPTSPRFTPEGGSVGPTSSRFVTKAGHGGPTSPRITPEGGPVGPTSPRITPEGGPVGPTSPRFATKFGHEVEPQTTTRTTPDSGHVGPVSPLFTPEGGLVGPTSPRITPESGPVGPTSTRITPEGGPVGPTSPRISPKGGSVGPTSPRFTTKGGHEGPTSPRFTPEGGPVGSTSPRITPKSGPVEPTSPRFTTEGGHEGPLFPSEGPSSSKFRLENGPVGPSNPRMASERGPQATSGAPRPSRSPTGGSGRRLPARKTVSRLKRASPGAPPPPPRAPPKPESRRIVPFRSPGAEPSASKDNTVCDLSGKRLLLEREDSVFSTSSKKSGVVNKILRILKWD